MSESGSDTKAYVCIGLVACAVVPTGIGVIRYLSEQSGEFLMWMILTWPIVMGWAAVVLCPLGAALGLSFFLGDKNERNILLGVALAIQIGTAFWLYGVEADCRGDNCPSFTTLLWIGSVLLWGVAIGTHAQLSKDRKAFIDDDHDWE